MQDRQEVQLGGAIANSTWVSYSRSWVQPATALVHTEQDVFNNIAVRHQPMSYLDESSRTGRLSRVQVRKNSRLHCKSVRPRLDRQIAGVMSPNVRHWPETAEPLMRSRFEAFRDGRAEWLLASWHSSTRPATIDLSDNPGMCLPYGSNQRAPVSACIHRRI